MEEEVLEVFPYLVEVMKLARVVFLNVTQSAVLLTLRHVDFCFFIVGANKWMASVVKVTGKPVLLTLHYL